MKTTAGVLLALPTIFYVMALAYGSLDASGFLFFGILCLLSAMGCLGCALYFWKKSRRLAWVCATVGSLYFVLLVVVPLVFYLLTPDPVKRSRRAETRRAGVVPVSVLTHF